MRPMAEKLQDRLAYAPRLFDEARAAVQLEAVPTMTAIHIDRRRHDPLIDQFSEFGRAESYIGNVDNLKDRRRDPVTRDRDRLEQRVKAMEQGRAP
jgi:hypothetical protein